MMKVWGYVRVSTEEQAVAGNGLAAQEETIQKICETKGWELVGIARDEGISGSHVLNRPAMLDALAVTCYGAKAAAGTLRWGAREGFYANGLPIRWESALDASVRARARQFSKAKLAGQAAEGLVVAKMDRLGRNLGDVSSILDLCQRFGVTVYVADMQIDTTQTSGRLMATMATIFAEWELAQIRERTRVSLAQVVKKGVKLGERPKIPAEVEARIAALREQQVPLAEIARTLTREGIPTAKGGTWHASTVARVLGRAA